MLAEVPERDGEIERGEAGRRRIGIDTITANVAAPGSPCSRERRTGKHDRTIATAQSPNCVSRERRSMRAPVRADDLGANAEDEQADSR